jgi:hypothetical protein
MVRKLEELPNFCCLTPGPDPFGIVPFLLLSYCCSLYTDFCIYLSKLFMLGLVMCFMSDFQMSLDDYPHCTLGKDGFLRTMGRQSYPIFMPKSSTHRMHDSGSIVPHIRLKLFTNNQMSRIKYNYYISSVSKD